MNDQDDQQGMFELDEADLALLEQVIDPELRHKWPRDLAMMVDVGASALRAEGLVEAHAARLAGKVLHAIAIYNGGRQFYIPRGTSTEVAIRDREIFHAWMHGRGTPEELARQYRVSYQWMMQIIAEQRGLWRAKHAPELPLFDGGK